MLSRIRFSTLMLATLILILTAVGCGGGGNSAATPTPRPLASFDFEDVCRRGTVEQASAYDAEAVGAIHPVLVFDNRNTETNSFYQITPSTLNFPVPWMVDSGDDFSTVEVVACLETVETTFIDTCEYDDDESSNVFLLDVYDVEYSVTAYAAQSGDNLGSGTLTAVSDDCPMFHMFSDEKEDYFPSVTMPELQAFLAPIVEP